MANSAFSKSTIVTPVSLANGGTGASLSDPNADRIMFWDDSAGSVAWLTAGTGLSITDTTISASGSVNRHAYISTLFEASGRFSSSAIGGGAATYGATGLSLASNGSANAGAYGYAEIVGVGVASFTGSPLFTFGFSLASLDTGGEFVVALGFWTTISSNVFLKTERHIGFLVQNSGGTITLYATQADGTTENRSSALTTVALNDYIEVVLQVNGTTSVDYYYAKNGAALSSATNLTSNMPTYNSSVERLVSWGVVSGSGADRFASAKCYSMSYQRSN